MGADTRNGGAARGKVTGQGNGKAENWRMGAALAAIRAGDWFSPDLLLRQSPPCFRFRGHILRFRHPKAAVIDMWRTIHSRRGNSAKSCACLVCQMPVTFGLQAAPVWRGDVLTLQRYPATIAAVWADAVERGRLSYEWNRRRGRRALLRAMLRMVSGPRNAWRYFVASDKSTKWALLRAVPIVLLIALASGVGAVQAALG